MTATEINELSKGLQKCIVQWCENNMPGCPAKDSLIDLGTLLTTTYINLQHNIANLGGQKQPKKYVVALMREVADILDNGTTDHVEDVEQEYHDKMTYHHDNN